MQRGEVWWADLPKPIGRRPVLLISRPEAYRVRDAVIVAEITSVIRNIPTEVYLAKEDGMPKSCVINLDVILTIRKNLLREKICHLTPEKIEQVNRSIKFALAL